MEINISGIIIEVRKKKIKNMYLSVKPPDGRVVISAPHIHEPPDNRSVCPVEAGMD